LALFTQAAAVADVLLVMEQLLVMEVTVVAVLALLMLVLEQVLPELQIQAVAAAVALTMVDLEALVVQVLL
jgi:hypothetical protein